MRTSFTGFALRRAETFFRKRTFFAPRGACHAVLSSEKNESVTELRGTLRLNESRKCPLDLDGICAVAESQPLRDADAVRVGDDGRLFPDIAKDQIGDLSADTR